MNDLLKKLNSKNITINLIDNKLDIKAPKGAVTPELLSEIKAHKQDLISFLSEFTVKDTVESIIPKTVSKSSYVLSSSQYRLWLLQQIEAENNVYNMPSVFSLKGALSTENLKAAFLKLTERHEILRTNIVVEEETGIPKQQITSFEKNDFSLKILDVSNEKNASEKLQAIIKSETEYVFNLEDEPLYRVSLIKKGIDDYVLVSVMHHIISDGWSSSVLIKDLFRLYTSISKDQSAALEPLAIQYKDYAEWQQLYLQSTAIEADEKYWLAQFKKESPALNIPTYKLRPSIKTYHGNTTDKAFDKNLIQNFKEVCKSEGATLFMGFLSLVKILLYKYTNEIDITVGSPFAGRESSELQNQIGFYANTVGLRSKFKKEDTFKSFLASVKKTTLDAYTHQNYPFDELIKNLKIKNDRSRNPLFDIVLTVDSNEVNSDALNKFENLEIQEINLDNNTSKFDLEFAFRENKTNTSLSVTYNTDIYEKDFIDQLTSHLEVLLNSIVEAATATIDKLSYLTKEEETRLLTTFNNTKVTFDNNKNTFIDVFHLLVKRSPNAIAVIYGDVQLTYGELDELSNQLAHYLIENYSISTESFIGVKLERSDWLIVSFLAVLKTGAAYLPIDLAYPEERISFIESDSECTVILDQAVISAFKNSKNQKKTKPEIRISNSNLAYVIYTSGSTGKPKGTLVEHAQLLNLCSWHIDHYNVNTSSRATLYSGTAFDASIWEMAPYLLVGAALYPISDTTIRLDITKLTSFLNEHKITHSYLPTAVTHELVNEDFTSDVITVLTGGDTLKVSESPKFRLYNNYGPTENTVVTTCFNLQEEFQTSVPIGKPIANTNCYILDENLSLLPIGIPGKLYVSGAGVVRGYLNKPNLTAERFIANPFVAGGCMYDTGDLAKWLPDGNIEFLGRKDTQVKIRGHRIELAEIENTINQFSETIQEAVLNVRKSSNEVQLEAFYVAKSTIENSELRDFLQEKLPSYMVPSYYMALDTIPLTANGKVDRRALPEIKSVSLVQREYVAPSNFIEEQLVNIWQEVLGVKQIGITDNFFDLGGHSLLVGQIINRVHQQLEKRITFTTFFNTPVIKELSKTLTNSKYKSIPKASLQANYPLTTSQQRIWVLNQLEGGNLAYNMSTVIKLTGDLEISKLEQAFQQLIKRHEILRTNFKDTEEGEVRQFITNEDAFTFKLSINHINNATSEVIDEELQKNQTIAFNLESDLLVRAKLYKIAKDTHLLSFTMHHIISDGWSIEIMISEVITVYNQLVQNRESDLPTLEIQYKDYAVWLASELTNEDYKKSEQYWFSQFQGELPIIDLPSFQQRPKIQTYKGNTLIHRFSNTFLQKLKDFSKKNEATLFMTLISGVNVLLHHYTSQNDIIIGTPIAGREHSDLEGQIGLYLNTLAIRTNIEPTESFTNLLAHQKEILLAAYEHQNYPFDELVEKLNIKRDTSRSVLFDVMVVLQSQSELQNIKSNNELEGVTVETYEIERKTSQFDISFTFVEKEELSLSIEYNTDIYDAFLIERMFAHYENLVSAAIDRPKKGITGINYITDTEKETVLSVFNDTQSAYAKEITLVDVFENQVIKTPNAIAVVFENNQLTYNELNEESNKLATYLTRNYDVQVNDFIGVKLERSEQLLISILGVLKTGAAYVPVDVNYPEERISYIENDSSCKIVIDKNELEKFKLSEKDNTKENIEYNIDANGLAYVIYTSGTTGKPKGVQIQHNNAVAMLHWAQKEFDATQIEVMYATTSHCFDLSIYELFYPLSTGKTVKILKNALAIADELVHDKKVVINTVPSSMRTLIDSDVSLQNVTNINLAGEPFPVDLAKKLLTTTATIRNLYGPSEDTTYSTAYKLSSVKNYQSSIPIGKPIKNSFAYILSENLAPLPIGVVGKLYMSGAGITRGYLNKEVLTAACYIDNPFVEGERMYDTGDLARWLPDGNIEFLGRKDNQVKIRGYRIELEEIENVIIQFSDTIQQVVVYIKETESEKELITYYVSETIIEKSRLKSFLQERLPSYMVPSYYQSLEVIPLTPNGKIDKKALQKITLKAVIQEEYIAPKTEEEVQLAKIWQEVLRLEKVGATDNFFDLGGHSLKAVRIINQLKKIGYSNTIQDFFEAPTIATLSTRLKTTLKLLPITKIEEQFDYSVTSSQRRLWTLGQFEDGNVAYNIPSAVTLKGSLNTKKMKEAIAQVIAKHEILRTSFKINTEGELRQYITPFNKLNFKVEELDVTTKTKEELDQKLNELHHTIFDISTGPLVRVSLLKMNSETYILSFVLHHIISDGWSMELLISETITNYNNLVEGIVCNNEDTNAIQYKDYTYWLQDQNNSEAYKTSETYWLQQFEGELPVLELPSFKKRPQIKTYNGASKQHRFSSQFLQTIKQFAAKEEASLFMVLMAGVNVLLSRYTNQKDIIIGTPIAGRNHPDLEKQIGLYLNTLAIRSKINEEETFITLLQQEKQTLLKAYKHQHYSFDELIEKLSIQRDTSRGALFDVMVVLQNHVQLESVVSSDTLKDITIAPYAIANEASKFDLRFTFVESDTLELDVQYNTDIYDEFLVDRIFNHFEILVTTAIQNSEENIQKLSFLTTKEREQLLTDFGQETVSYNKELTVVDVFNQQVNQTPNNIAVVSNNRALTYEALNKLADKLASYLQTHYGVKIGDTVGVCLTKSEWSIVAILGILKAGAAYVPIDEKLPNDRKKIIANDAGTEVIVTEEAFVADVSQFSGKAIVLDADFDKKASPVALSQTITPQSTAYIIYTSGSTGTPKGVMVSHANLVDYTFGLYENTAIKNSKSFALMSNIATDLGNTVLYGALLSGGTLHLPTKEMLSDVHAMHNYFDQYEIDCMKIVPSHWKALVKKDKLLLPNTTIVFGGDVLPVSYVHDIKQQNPTLTIINHYGPTETTIGKLMLTVDKELNETSIPIGKPFSNTSIYVVNEALELCPVGSPGELLIGGAGVAKGYINNKKRTEESFIKNPFSNTEARVYKTGDLVRWLPNGTIDFLGRKDNQIKLRGYRIELDEIEHVLRNEAKVEQAVVLIKEFNNEKYLVAYLVGTAIDVQEIHQSIETKLPNYMLPNHYLVVDEMPFTPNGKVDRKKLLALSEEKVNTNEYVAPETETEKQLTTIWEVLLGKEKISVRDNFFDLGGHSLHITRMLYEIEETFAIKLQLKAVFESRNIKQLAKILDSELILKGGLAFSEIENETDQSINNKNVETWEI